MHTPLHEPQEALRLCGLLPALTADCPEALAECLAALDGYGFPFAEVEAVSHTEERDIARLLPPLSGLTVAASAAVVAHGAAWVVFPADNAAQGAAASGEYRLFNVAASVQPIADRESGTDCLHSAAAGTANSLPLSERQPEANSPRNAATCPCDPPNDLPACRIVATAPQGEAISAALQDAGITAVRLSVRVTRQNALAVAAQLHDLWVSSLGFTLMHIGLNAADAAEADGVAARFASLLGMAHTSGPQSSYAGSMVEVMKGGGRGAHGHIGVGTASLPRAMYYAGRRGFAFDMASRKNDAAGNPILYYLAQDIAGYAVHFLQR